LIPLYISNSLPVLLGGGQRLDFSKIAWDGRDLLGEGKTIRGTFAALISGVLVVYGLSFLFPILIGDFPVNYTEYGVLLIVGGVMGDLVASFAKRRMNWAAGKPVLGLDQLDFIIGGLLMGSILWVPNIIEIGIIVLVTLVLHKGMNYLAFKLHWKKVPW